jgi:transcriptional regulator with XRE-family HTH domain
MEPTQIVNELKKWMTQTEIAEAVGCSQATISEIQNGKQKRPTYQLAIALNALYERKLAEAAGDEIARNAASDDVQGLGGSIDPDDKLCKMPQAA